ncbi:MAG: hypothetical protein CMO29_13945, partial [Tistrella sp.]|nr:hypothetical protein [Tistrella sp.]
MASTTEPAAAPRQAPRGLARGPESEGTTDVIGLEVLFGATEEALDGGEGFSVPSEVYEEFGPSAVDRAVA